MKAQSSGKMGLGGWRWAQHHSHSPWSSRFQEWQDPEGVKLSVLNYFLIQSPWSPEPSVESVIHTNLGYRVLRGMRRGDFLPCLKQWGLREGSSHGWEKQTRYSEPSGRRIPRLRRPKKCTSQAPSTHIDIPYCPSPSQDPQKHQGGHWAPQNTWGGDSFYLTTKERELLQSWQI